MKQAYEIIHWPNGKVIQLVETKEHAINSLMHMVKDI